MTNYVLVHGAWHGAWYWEKVIKHLEVVKETHSIGEILTPELPGHSLRFNKDLRRITMEHYIHAVVTPVQVRRLDNVVLVGQGFAGTFLPQVAVELGERVKRVVFLAGYLPSEGKSAYDMLPVPLKLLVRIFKPEEKGVRFPDFLFKSLLCNGMDSNAAQELLSRLVPDPFLPWKTPVSRRDFLSKQFLTTYVMLTRDRAMPIKLQYLYTQALDSPQVIELDAGHEAVLSHPGEIADILLKYA